MTYSIWHSREFHAIEPGAEPPAFAAGMPQGPVKVHEFEASTIGAILRGYGAFMQSIESEEAKGGGPMFHVIYWDDREGGSSNIDEFDSKEKAEKFITAYMQDCRHMELRDFTVIEGRKLAIKTIEVVSRIQLI